MTLAFAALEGGVRVYLLASYTPAPGFRQAGSDWEEPQRSVVVHDNADMHGWGHLDAGAWLVDSLVSVRDSQNSAEPGTVGSTDLGGLHQSRKYWSRVSVRWMKKVRMSKILEALFGFGGLPC